MKTYYKKILVYKILNYIYINRKNNNNKYGTQNVLGKSRDKIFVGENKRFYIFRRKDEYSKLGQS